MTRKVDEQRAQICLKPEGIHTKRRQMSPFENIFKLNLVDRRDFVAVA
jgi:hypothetical protein